MQEYKEESLLGRYHHIVLITSQDVCHYQSWCLLPPNSRSNLLWSAGLIVCLSLFPFQARDAQQIQDNWSHCMGGCLYSVFAGGAEGTHLSQRLLHAYIIVFLDQVQLRTEVLRTPSSTRLGFKLMTSRSWLYISCHWDACSNHLAISDSGWLIRWQWLTM